jgi:ABC-type antimicrobial peptide transport system permease subunit
MLQMLFLQLKWVTASLFRVRLRIVRLRLSNRPTLSSHLIILDLSSGVMLQQQFNSGQEQSTQYKLLQAVLDTLLDQLSLLVAMVMRHKLEH